MEGESVVPKKKASALSALARHDSERRALEDRGAELRRAAALELGFAVLDAGGAGLSLAEVKSVIAAAVQPISTVMAASAGAARDGVAPSGSYATRTDDEGVRHG